MKIVTYNVNGLRPRIAQFGSLLKLLDSFDADIICFQETKLRRQDLKADSVMADGYESFFSCTRTSEKGRAAYSGVATFCRVKSAFSSNEVALPVEAEEGFTGLLRNSQIGKGEGPEVAEWLEKFEKEEILKVDSEGRCVITDHYHFVLFNIYGPRADSDDTERVQFKLNFFKMLQRRWESLLHCGRRIFVVGDLNIAPTSMDRCDAGPEFENNEFRKWFRSLLVEHGGHFLDAFRSKHPDRRDAYTCWPQNTGGEVFNYGSRIDHILCAGSCLHQVPNQQGHDFVTCHVTECEILTQYKRWKHGNSFRWKGERNVKLEGSDHAPVHINLLEMPDIPQHNTPSLSARYIPMIHGLQQTLVSLLMKRKATEETIICKSTSSFDQNISALDNCGTSQVPSHVSFTLSNPESGGIVPKIGENDKSFTNDNPYGFERTKMMPGNETKKRKRQLSQMSLKSFFCRSSEVENDSDSSRAKVTFVEAEVSQSNKNSCETLGLGLQSCSSEKHVYSAQDRDEEDAHAYSSEKLKNDTALSEWRRIQKVMQNSIPVCKGHSEPCVTQIVKKQGPNFGRRFYVCARAEGPASNPDANCGFFKWAASKNRHK